MLNGIVIGIDSETIIHAQYPEYEVTVDDKAIIKFDKDGILLLAERIGNRWVVYSLEFIRLFLEDVVTMKKIKKGGLI